MKHAKNNNNSAGINGSVAPAFVVVVVFSDDGDPVGGAQDGLLISPPTIQKPSAPHCMVWPGRLVSGQGVPPGQV
jgi:hypothetical protein